MVVAADIAMQIVTWLLVIAGWLVLSDQQESREFSKHVSQRLTNLRQDLLRIEALAKAHHTSGYQIASVQEIIGLLGAFSEELAFLRKSGVVGLSTVELVAVFRKAVSSKNMDESTYLPEAVDGDLIISILSARQVLDRELLISVHTVMRSRRTLLDSLYAKLGVARRAS